MGGVSPSGDTPTVGGRTPGPHSPDVVGADPPKVRFADAPPPRIDEPPTTFGRQISGPAPSAETTGRTIGTRPVRSGYNARTALPRRSTASAWTRLTVQPPKPAPVMRAATTPGTSIAISTRASSSGELT